jgi:hypothetical protein
MREAVGSRNHKTAVAMVRAADALWDACGGHDPAVSAATTQRRRSLAPTGRKKNDRRNGTTTVPKVALLTAPISFLF